MAAARRSLALPILSRKKSTGRATLCGAGNKTPDSTRQNVQPIRLPNREVIFYLAIRRRSQYHLQTVVSKMNSISISRRKFAQLLSAGAACAVVKPALSLAKSAPEVKNQSASPLTRIVRLSSNENPYGPSPPALKAMTDSFSVACRYPDEAAALLSEKLA